MSEDWLDELLDSQDDSSRAEKRLDYALYLLGNSPYRCDDRMELELLDTYRDLDDLEWEQWFVMLRLNQLRCVDNYSYTQRELNRWIRLIAFHEL